MARVFPMKSEAFHETASSPRRSAAKAVTPSGGNSLNDPERASRAGHRGGEASHGNR
ncbi:MAG TPA: KGG domain-containing protein [Methylocella sp.]|nr:KGG domain-containing protein [Methylocella sp.]